MSCNRLGNITASYLGRLDTYIYIYMIKLV